MLADTSFTMKSGPLGTSMFSRSGKVTNYQYVCFNNEHNQVTVNEDVDAIDEQQILNDQVMAQQQNTKGKHGDYLDRVNVSTMNGFSKTSDMNATVKTSKR